MRACAAFRGSFSYTQARTQARYAALPAEADWQRLSGLRSLSAWLEEARNGALKPWVKGFSAQSGSADLERGIRGLWLETVDDTARLSPGPWQPAVRWCRWLAVLPLLDHLRRGGPPPAWVAADWRLAPLPSALAAPRRRGDLDRLGALTTTDQTPVDTCWQREWLALWPRRRGADAEALRVLLQRLEAHRVAFAAASPEQTWTLRRRLRESLRLEFHRNLLQPAGTFLYLALVALDLERLRRALLDRLLYPADLQSLPDPDAPAASAPATQPR